MTAENNKMNPKVLQEEYEESKIKLIMAQYAELEGRKFFEENERLCKIDAYLPSGKQTKNFKRRLNYHLIKFRVKKVIKWFIPSRYLNIATALSLLVVLLLTSFFSVEAFRANVLNFFIQVEKEYTAIKLTDDSTHLSDHLEVEWENAYAPQKVPLGFRIVNASYNQNVKVIEYENEENGFIVFQQHNENAGIHVDTEDADEVYNALIHGQEGLFVRKNDVMQLVWKERNQLFLLIGSANDLSREQLFKMAESVLFIK